MGGAVFVMEGGSLSFGGSLTVARNSATGGSGAFALAVGSPRVSEDGHAFGAGMFLNGSGTLNFQPGVGETQTIADTIADEAGVIANGYVAPPLGYVVTNPAGNTTFTPVAFEAGSYGLTKNGAGTLILDGTNSYTGGTIVNAGTLGGHGTIGAVTVNNGGILAPGASAGILHTGNLTFAAGATFAVELGGMLPGQYDQLDVTGTVSLGGATLDLSVLGGFSPLDGGQFVIIDNDGAMDAVTGTFTGLAEGTGFAAGGSRYTISYAGGDGNDVVLVAANSDAIIVTTNLDVGNASDGLTSLREAITFANANPGTTITFAAALAGTDHYADRRAARSSSATTPSSTAATTTSRSAAPTRSASSSSAMRICSPPLIEPRRRSANLTIADAKASGGAGGAGGGGGGGAGLGGAILVSSTGSLTLTDVHLASNIASGGAGALGAGGSGGGGMGGIGGPGSGNTTATAGGGGGGFGRGADGGAPFLNGGDGAFTGGASGGAFGAGRTGGTEGGGGAGTGGQGGSGGGVGGACRPRQ